MSKLFTHHEDEILIAKYHNTDIDTLSSLINRTKQAIKMRAFRLGLRKDVQYLSKIRCNIAKQYQKYDVNHYYFDKIDTKEKAYWLGFIWADGCIFQKKHSSHYGLRIQLHEKDIEILERFSQDLNSTYPIKKVQTPTTPSVVVYISSENIYHDLIDKGVERNKTYGSSIPKLPMLYYPDFMRGLFDGDGSCFIDRDSLVCNITNTQQTINFVRNILLDNLNIYGSLYCDDHYARLTISGRNQVIKFANFIYRNNDSSIFFLQRKKQKFIDGGIL